MESQPIRANDKWLLWSGLYAIVFLIVAGYVNYVLPYSPKPVTHPTCVHLIGWGLTYFPIIVLSLAARQSIIDYGFALGPRVALATILVSILVAAPNVPSDITAEVSWVGSVAEAFARTGEEVFFRGFLFAILTQLFRNRRRPWLWAAIASSLLFALIHTQFLQPSFLSQYGSPSAPVIYKVAERLINLFIAALLLALLRAWTRSILPGAIVHSVQYAGIRTLPFVLIIYASLVFWARTRGDLVAVGSGVNRSA